MPSTRKRGGRFDGTLSVTLSLRLLQTLAILVNLTKPAQSLQIGVLGDGDFSFSSALSNSPHLAPDTVITATVLESKEKHRAIYSRSVANTNVLTSSNRRQQHRVVYGVDITKPATLPFERHSLDCCIFNFPHHVGKANIKRNRQLISNIFAGINPYLAGVGEMKIALLQGQSGVESVNNVEWKASWQIQLHAITNGFYLRQVEDFVELDGYSPRSYRGTDRGFGVRDDGVSRGGKRRVYSFCNAAAASFSMDAGQDECDVCYYHELHIDIVKEGYIHGMLQQCPTTKTVHSCVKAIVENFENPLPVHVSVRLLEDLRPAMKCLCFEVVYTSKFLTRDQANLLCSLVENAQGLCVRENKKGRTVSHLIPFSMNKERIENWGDKSKR